jgi:hypothetical protein
MIPIGTEDITHGMVLAAVDVQLLFGWIILYYHYTTTIGATETTKMWSLSKTYT